jgi:seryl-tRNA synthetase
MATLTLPLEGIEEQYLSQLEYALAFLAEDVLKSWIDRSTNTLHADLAEGADPEVVMQKLQQLRDRYQKSEFGHKDVTYFEQNADVVQVDAWGELLERKWATEVGDGHVVLRGDAAALMDMVDQSVLRDFAGPFQAELEIYPATILCQSLDRCNHFTSFPEHLDFVAHLKPDVDKLKQFSQDCQEGDWSPDFHNGRMADIQFAISPSCCYHCYEAMEGWELDKPGRCITAVVGCHRFEGANQTTLSRLRAFTMREVVWVGHPKFVLESRAKAEEALVAQVTRWGLHCRFETANDMFFTDDYAVKASFQRQQEAKKELRGLIPQEDKMISLMSSNFHSATFGKAFNIKVGGRPAASACLGWGLERIVYAIFSQFGLDPAAWPVGLRDEFSAYKQARGAGK